MVKTILGVDIGYDSLKLALVNGGSVKKTVSVPMPKNLVREGRIVSGESVGELIRTTMKENGMRARSAAYVLPNESVYVKNVAMPVMNEEQLVYNLPYEFHDYITDELHDYVFDYAMISTPEDIAARRSEAEDAAPLMELMAVSAPRSLIEETRDTLRKAGLTLEKTAPALCSYLPLIRRLERDPESACGEYCILDLGFQSIRMYMFRGDRHIVTRVLEIGLSSLDDVIADGYSVDVHLAHTYLLTNYEDCQRRDFCMNTYDNIAVELLRALNFYHFSNPDSQLADVWLCGGGAMIRPLRDAIEETLDMRIHRAEELVPGGDQIEDCNSFVQAVGMAMD